MRKIYFVAAMLLSSLAFAQVGINTDTPEATLHVSKDSNNPTPGYTNGGMILEYPGVEKTTLAFSDLISGITELQNQNILVQNATDGKVNHMKRWAFTYLPARPSHLPFLGYQAINEKDYTILVRGNITLPTGDQFVGKMINLVYDAQTELSYNITGPMKYKGFLINSLPINDKNVGYTLQSDGEKWFVVGGYENYQPSPSIITMTSGTVSVEDSGKTILVQGAITLPEASSAKGAEYTFIYDGSGGATYDVSYNSISFTLNDSDDGRLFKLQSVGTHWELLYQK